MKEIYYNSASSLFACNKQQLKIVCRVSLIIAIIMCTAGCSLFTSRNNEDQKSQELFADAKRVHEYCVTAKIEKYIGPGVYVLQNMDDNTLLAAIHIIRTGKDSSEFWGDLAAVIVRYHRIQALNNPITIAINIGDGDILTLYASPHCQDQF